MNANTLISHSAQLLKIIIKSPQPADRIAHQYFRGKKYIGSNDRKFISETTFLTQRFYTYAEFLTNKVFHNYEHILFHKNVPNLEQLEKHKKEIFICLIALIIFLKKFPDQSIYINKSTTLSYDIILDSILFFFQINQEDLNSVNSELNNMYTEHLSQINKLSLSDLNKPEYIELLSTVFSIPPYFLNSVRTLFSDIDDLIKLLNSFLSSAKVNLRVNLNKASSTNVIDFLKKENITASQSGIVPSAIILDSRANLNQNPLYLSGIIDIQDLGSQLISYAAAPHPQDSILDACAGAGGKSLMLAMIQNDSGSITATDIERKRLFEIPARAKRCGFKSIRHYLIQTKNKKNTQNSPLNKLYDIVFVDAPCSGAGTIRRMPMQKYKINEKYLAKISANQFEILTNYSKNVRPGGYLLYATCSVLPQENQNLVAQFLKHNPDFIPDPLAPALEKNNIHITSLKPEDYMLTLLPSVHQSDGFFIARLKRVE